MAFAGPFLAAEGLCRSASVLGETSLCNVCIQFHGNSNVCERRRRDEAEHAHSMRSAHEAEVSETQRASDATSSSSFHYAESKAPSLEEVPWFPFPRVCFVRAEIYFSMSLYRLQR